MSSARPDDRFDPTTIDIIVWILIDGLLDGFDHDVAEYLVRRRYIANRDHITWEGDRIAMKLHRGPTITIELGKGQGKVTAGDPSGAFFKGDAGARARWETMKAQARSEGRSARGDVFG